MPEVPPTITAFCSSSTSFSMLTERGSSVCSSDQSFTCRTLMLNEVISGNDGKRRQEREAGFRRPLS
jgi:hypothetical protein